MTSKDETFLTFSRDQAALYAKFRGDSYPPLLYQSVIDYHKADDGLHFDVGTGPGRVVFDFLNHFKRGIGCDTSPEMVGQAKRDAAQHGGEIESRTRFFVAGAERCSELLEHQEVGNVDVMTVAMAAHWFDLPAFYAQAAKALKPGGTLALWTCSSYYCHPSELRHNEIQEILSDFEDNLLGPYMTPGNHVSRSGYRTLGLPWELGLSGSFEQSSLLRQDWDLDGIPSAPSLPDGTPGPYLKMGVTDVDEWEKGAGSSSAVARWQAANPELVGTDRDIVRITMDRLRKVLDGRKTFVSAPSTSLLLLRRSAI